jgi:hypothetical protein
MEREMVSEKLRQLPWHFVKNDAINIRKVFSECVVIGRGERSAETKGHKYLRVV